MALQDGQSGVMFLALTFVLVVVVALVCPNLQTAILIIGLLVGVVACLYRTTKEGFNPVRATTGHPAPHAVSAKVDAVQAPSTVPSRQRLDPPYKGAIDIDEYDTAPEHGHRDRRIGENESAPYGNPFDTDRIASPQAAGANLDDEANDDELDGDERNAYQVRSRNEHARVTAGTMDRRKMLDPYFREELDQEEDSHWWGRHEI